MTCTLCPDKKYSLPKEIDILVSDWLYADQPDIQRYCKMPRKVKKVGPTVRLLSISFPLIFLGRHNLGSFHLNSQLKGQTVISHRKVLLKKTQQVNDRSPNLNSERRLDHVEMNRANAPESKLEMSVISNPASSVLPDVMPFFTQRHLASNTMVPSAPK